MQKLNTLGSLCHGTRKVQQRGERLYVHFSDIRDACLAFSNIRLAGTDWIASYISAIESCKVRTTIYLNFVAVDAEGSLGLQEHWFLHVSRCL
jgi:hypothetical protein